MRNSSHNAINLSIIVPVYNCEKYINKLLLSLSRQTFKRFELIILDDGSSDSTVKVIEKFSNSSPNWHLFKLEHNGISKLRNIGLILSCGNYISFIDADDYVEINFLEEIFKKNNLKEIDIAICNYMIYFSKFNIRLPDILNLLFVRSGIYESSKILGGIILDIRFRSYLWGKIFRRGIFFENSIIFPDICYEDYAVMPRVLFFSKKILIKNKYLYNYNKHSNNFSSNSLSKQKIDCFSKSIELIRDFLNSNKCFNKYKIHYYFIKFKFILIIVFYFLKQIVIKISLIFSLKK